MVKLAFYRNLMSFENQSSRHLENLLTNFRFLQHLLIGQPSPRNKRIMSSTSQKHRNFVSEPMGEKDVTELAGIGEVLGGKLKEKGFDKAYVVLGQFLVLKKDQEMFMDWIKDECGANKKQGGDCYNCLKEWCDAFL